MDRPRLLFALALAASLPSCKTSLHLPDITTGQVTGTIRGLDHLPLQGAAAIPLAHDTLLHVTDSTGVYRLALPAGPQVITFGMLDVAKVQDTVTVVAGRSVTHNVVLATLAPAHLTILVVDGEGKPVPEAQVTILVGGAGHAWQTDTTGLAHDVVRPGLVRVGAWRKGAFDWQVWDSLSAATGQRVTVRLRMEHAVYVPVAH